MISSILFVLFLLIISYFNFQRISSNNFVYITIMLKFLVRFCFALLPSVCCCCRVVVCLCVFCFVYLWYLLQSKYTFYFTLAITTANDVVFVSASKCFTCLLCFCFLLLALFVLYPPRAHECVCAVTCGSWRCVFTFLFLFTRMWVNCVALSTMVLGWCVCLCICVCVF